MAGLGLVMEDIKITDLLKHCYYAYCSYSFADIADLLYELTADDGETIEAVSQDTLETLSNCFEIYIVN